MSKNRGVVKLTENQLVTLIRTMVDKTVKSEEKKWVMESKRKLAAKINEQGFAPTQELATYEVEFWFQNRDAYDYDVLTVEAASEEEAIYKAQTEGGIQSINGGYTKPPRGAKSFKAIKIY